MTRARESMYFQPRIPVSFTTLEGQLSLEPFTSVPLLFLVEPQRSLTIVIMTNQYGLLHRPRVPQPSFSAALEFLNTDPKHSPGKVPSQGSML